MSLSDSFDTASDSYRRMFAASHKDAKISRHHEIILLSRLMEGFVTRDADATNQYIEDAPDEFAEISTLAALARNPSFYGRSQIDAQEYGDLIDRFESGFISMGIVLRDQADEHRTVLLDQFSLLVTADAFMKMQREIRNGAEEGKIVHFSSLNPFLMSHVATEILQTMWQSISAKGRDVMPNGTHIFLQKLDYFQAGLRSAFPADVETHRTTPDQNVAAYLALGALNDVITSTYKKPSYCVLFKADEATLGALQACLAPLFDKPQASITQETGVCLSLKEMAQKLQEKRERHARRIAEGYLPPS